MSYVRPQSARSFARYGFVPVLLAALLAGCSLTSPLGGATTPATSLPQPSAQAAAPTGEPARPGGQPTSAPTAQAGSAPTERAASTPAPTESAASAPLTGDQPALLTGTFTYTNDIITRYYVEHSVMLYDMYGFVKRDKEWELPVDSQVLGYLKMDQQKREGTFRLQLPVQPAGTLIDVDNNSTQDKGVEIFALAYAPNLTGDPFSVGDDRSKGWPSYLASTRNDSENEDEVIGGKLIVWAPDGQQQFPTGFGADKKLFTKDDPVGPIPAGYSVVDLSKEPFTLSRTPQQQFTLYEPQDAAIKDFSQLSYTEAFKRMFDRIRTEYAFNGIAGKEPKWDELYAQLSPRVQQAEQKRDQQAFYEVMRDFTNAFRDGHVGLSGGDFFLKEFRARFGGGYGMAVRELDNGLFIVTFVTEGGSAEQNGIKVGAEIISFDGKPVKQVAQAVQPLEGPFSTDYGLRYQQARYLVRAPVGTRAGIAFRNPGQQERTVTLSAEQEIASYFATDLTRNQTPNALPVEFRTLPSGVGYIKINSNNDDLNLLIRLFQRALQTFKDEQAPGVIIDLRVNFGGSPLGLAGFLTDKEIPLGQSEYYSEETGKFEPEGSPDKVTPNEEQYRFDKVVLLVDQSCYSACEIEAYGFSQVPGVQVVGQYPTAGVFAEVARGQYKLPDGLSLQVPTGRTVLPDGSLFLEGKGVPPTVRVPIDEKTVLSNDDVVLARAEQVIVGR